MKRKVNVEKGKKGFQKTVPQAKEPPKKLTTPTVETPPKLTPRNVLKNWEQHLYMFATGEPGEVDKEEYMEGERYSFEELETLWVLTSDNNGKLPDGVSNTFQNRRTAWGEKEAELFNNFVNQVQAGGGATPEVWYKLFKTFGAEVKVNYLKQHCHEVFFSLKKMALSTANRSYLSHNASTTYGKWVQKEKGNLIMKNGKNMKTIRKRLTTIAKVYL